MYRYTREEWEQIRSRKEIEDRAQARAYAEDMDNWSALRQEQEENKHLLTFPRQERRAA